MQGNDEGIHRKYLNANRRMKWKLIVNVIPRPKMVPEYAEKVTGHGKEEDIGRKALLTESLDMRVFSMKRL